MNTRIVIFTLLITLIYSNHKYRVKDLIQDDAVFKVYHLQAPLFENKYGDLFAIFKAYHVAIGFVNVNNEQESYQTEYIAVPTVPDTLFPTLKDGEVIWNCSGKALVVPKLNFTYWTTIKELYEINGAMVKTFFEYVDQFDRDHQQYGLLQVKNVTTEELIMKSSNCFDFLMEGFQYLIDIGAKKTCVDKTIKIDFTYILTNQDPIVFDYEIHKEEIYSYYSDFYKLVNETIHFKLSIIEVIEKFTDLFGKRYILHYVDEKYYKFDLSLPFLKYYYRDIEIPA